MDNLRISLVQQNIAWEDKEMNLSYMHDMVYALRNETDIVVFPEMCTTGFSMNSHKLAETNEENTISQIKSWSKKYNLAISGSFIAKQGAEYYNRGFFITPYDEHYYDKRHLFRMGAEAESFSAGKEKVVFEYKGYNICLLICYDIRFPVWSRNIDMRYDLLIFVANWPASRINVWESLLTSRALENMSYVCGVNRVGVDGIGIKYNGYSKLINAKGEELINMRNNQSEVETSEISKLELDQFRNKFPVWMDADRFEVKI